MKRLLLLLLLCLLPCLAAAETLPARAVGRTSEGENIFELIADNGQALYFTSIEPAPFVKKEDVNFDGVPDIVVCVSSGASNGYFEFFVNNNGQYVQAAHDGMGAGLANYQLYPEQGAVFSQASAGHAGALHVWHLFRWQGTDLQLVSSAVSDELTESTFTDISWTQTVYSGLYEVTVTHYGENAWEWEVVLQKTVTEEDIITGNIFEEERAILWQGLQQPDRRIERTCGE